MEIISNNRAKLEYYNSLLDNVEEELLDLELEKNKIDKNYNKNKKRIGNFHVFMNVFIMTLIGILTFNIILPINMIELPIIAGTLGCLVLSVELVKKAVLELHESNNNINNIENKVNEFKKYEALNNKKEIENILVIRNFLNNILENNHIFNFEKNEFISNILSNNDKILDDFNIDELNVMTSYLQQLIMNNCSYDIDTPICKISNIEELEEKGYQKTLK